jgi:hypothetical protein
MLQGFGLLMLGCAVLTLIDRYFQRDGATLISATRSRGPNLYSIGPRLFSRLDRVRRPTFFRRSGRTARGSWALGPN